MKTYLFYVEGTHCKACKVLIEDVLGKEYPGSRVKVDLHAKTVEVDVEGSFSEAEIAEVVNGLVKPYGYKLSLESPESRRDFGSLVVALPVGVMVLALFFLLQKSGIVNFGFEGGLTPWTALLIGGIASVSTCLAVTGGLILSLSAKVSQDASTVRPFMFFHVGRLLGFAVLGGVLGMIGSTVALSHTFGAVLGLLAALVMIILGVNLLDVFHVTKKFQLHLPAGFFKKITKIENGFFAPFLVGVATFFLPCGFTQSMQIAALSSGSVLNGVLIMGMFALGTLPMLALISFSSFKFAHSRYASLFFKSAGVVVIGLGIFAFLAGLVGLGVIKPLFNF